MLQRALHFTLTFASPHINHFKKNMKIKRLVFLLLPSLLCSTAFATKMCPPEPPCFDPDHKFNSDKCTQTSDWVAVGKIEDVIDDKKGDPLNKNFATFKFKVIR